MKQYGSTTLGALPTESVLTHIAGLIHDVASLYQIPNWTVSNSAHLASWILRNYKYDMLKTVTECLENPPTTTDERGNEEKIWRLTPDTINGWMAVKLDQLAEKREQYIHNKKFEEAAPIEMPPISEETLKLIEDRKKEIGSIVEPKKIRPITQEEIQKEGQEKPPPKDYILPLSEIDVENIDLAHQYGVTVFQIRGLRRQWMLDCFHIHTGNRLPNWISFPEWLIS